jgi:hypothetical protein
MKILDIENWKRKEHYEFFLKWQVRILELQQK